MSLALHRKIIKVNLFVVLKVLRKYFIQTSVYRIKRISDLNLFSVSVVHLSSVSSRVFLLVHLTRF